MDIDACVKVVDERVENHVEVELFTIFCVLEYIESIVVRDESCYCDCHGDCWVFVVYLTHD